MCNNINHKMVPVRLTEKNCDWYVSILVFVYTVANKNWGSIIAWE